MKRFLILLACALLLLPGCAAKPQTQSKGIAVVATLFPQYDFARQIVGDTAQVTLLLPPGVESHSYEPTPADIVRITEADVFLYTGQYMEPWAQDIIASLPASVRVVDVSAGLTLDKQAHDEEEQAEEGAAHDHGGYDPHIWTDPTMAVTMVGNIAEGLCAADPANAEAYRARAKAYNEELLALDADIMQVVEQAKHKELCFGGRFAMHYFAKRYGLSYIAAYDSCSEETEPSAKAIADIVQRMKTDGLRVVYYEELIDPQVARAIAAETGAETLLLHSCHNVSAQEFSSGATYLSLMRNNLENLKVGLN